MKNEYLADITSKNDFLEGLTKTIAESETKLEKVKQEYEANYNEMVDIYRKNEEKSNSKLKNAIEKIKDEYQSGIDSKNCKIQELEIVKTKLEKSEKIVTSNNNKIQGLDHMVGMRCLYLHQKTHLIFNTSYARHTTHRHNSTTPGNYVA